MGSKNNKRKPSSYKTKNNSFNQTKSKSVNHNKSNTQKVVTVSNKAKPKEFPNTFPFWARLKIEKRRTALIIDEDIATNKKTNKKENVYVHREATHTYKSEYQEIMPNPDKSDPKPMYLKKPKIKPKRMFEPHNKNLTMPEDLKKQYEKNTKK